MAGDEDWEFNDDENLTADEALSRFTTPPSYTKHASCPRPNCKESFSGEGKTEAIAQGLATRKANEHARSCTN